MDRSDRCSEPFPGIIDGLSRKHRIRCEKHKDHGSKELNYKTEHVWRGLVNEKRVTIIWEDA